MIPFATEFPVQPADKADFVGHVLGWLRGSPHSTLLADLKDADFDGDAPVLRSSAGEELRLRVLDREGESIGIGFRHDFPDDHGRYWRTEAVIRKGAARDGQDLIRLRTQCVARTAGAKLETPRKPFLIKTLMQDGWGGTDRHLATDDQPTWLVANEDALLLAGAAATGEASQYLPVVYISAEGPNKWALSRDLIEKLAYDIGGVGHVLVEPSRDFAVKLREVSGGRNAYGGTIGVALPGRGNVRRFFLGGVLKEPRDLGAAVRDFVCTVRSQMPSEGWDWTELQEQALRQQRERERKRLSNSETEALYEEEIANLRDQVEALKVQISNLEPHNGVADDALSFASLKGQMGPEVYPGELGDRLRAAARSALAQADRDGLDPRSRAVLTDFAARPPSTGLGELKEALRRATKDPDRMASQLEEVLSRHGFKKAPQGKHVKLEPRAELSGLEAIVIPSTPSEIRGLKNARTQIERSLGISRLDD